MKRLAFDLESDGLLPTVSEIHCINVECLETGEKRRFVSERAKKLIPEVFNCPSIEDGIELLQEADYIVGHNIIDYDIPAIQKIYDFNPKGRVIDTLAVSRLIKTNLMNDDWNWHRRGGLPKGFTGKLYGSHSLKAWGYRLGELKGDYGETSDWSTPDLEMIEYCDQDVTVTVKLYNYLLKQGFSRESIDLEHKFLEVISRQSRFGWHFDTNKALELRNELILQKEKLTEELREHFGGWDNEMKSPEYMYIEYDCATYKASTKTKLVNDVYKSDVTGLTKTALNKLVKAGPLKKRHTPFNPGSGDHIARALKEQYNWKPTVMTPSGKPQVDEKILSNLPFKEAKLILEYMKTNKILSMVAGKNGKGGGWLKALEDYNDGRIHGYVNTNGAVTGRCTHSKPNVAQVPSVKVNKKTGKPKTGLEGGYGYECRSLFSSPVGYKIVGCDASGLELRCLAHFLAFWDNGEYAKVILEGDIHTHNQEMAGLSERDQAKTFIYALIYGGGDAKLGEIIGGSSKQGKVLRDRFMEGLPAYAKLIDAVGRQVAKGYLVGLDGRRLFVRNEYSALNTLLQSAGALIMKQALVIADKKLQESGLVPFGKGGDDYEFVGNIHDEMQVQVKEGLEDQVGQTMVDAIREAGEHFKFKCPLDGEYKVGNSWAETH